MEGRVLVLRSLLVMWRHQTTTYITPTDVMLRAGREDFFQHACVDACVDFREPRPVSLLDA